jgi:hypothetical protein
MIHPVLRLAAAQPMLVAAHAGAYLGLLSEELICSVRILQRRWMWQLTALLSFVTAAVLAGVATMLWVLFSAEAQRATWALIGVPLLPAVFGLWAWWMADRNLWPSPFARLQSQLQADAHLLSLSSVP